MNLQYTNPEGAPRSAKYLVTTSNTKLSAEIDLGALTTGLLLSTVSGGESTISIITNNSTNWDTAYGWGNHAGLYSLAGHNHAGVYEPADATILKSAAIGVSVQAYNATLAAVAGGTYAGDDSITTVGTITAGVWNGTDIAVADGGTGASTAEAACSALGVGTEDSPTFSGMDLRDSDVAHGITTYAATDAYFKLETDSATAGGVRVWGFGDTVGQRAFVFLGILGDADPTDSVGCITLAGGKKNGTGVQALGAAETVMIVENWGTPLMTVTGNGNAWFVADVSVLSLTDRTPYYEGDALSEIMKIKGKNGEIDHSTLPAFARKKVKDEKGNKVDGRDISAMTSMYGVAIQQLYNQLQALKTNNNLI